MSYYFLTLLIILRSDALWLSFFISSSGFSGNLSVIGSTYFLMNPRFLALELIILFFFLLLPYDSLSFSNCLTFSSPSILACIVLSIVEAAVEHLLSAKIFFSNFNS